MVIAKLIEEGGPQFLKLMTESKSIEIGFVDLNYGTAYHVNCPKMAVMAVSGQMRYLISMGYEEYVTFGQLLSDSTNPQILQARARKFEDNMIWGTRTQLLQHFAAWLYTSTTSLGNLCVWDLWNFAGTLKAPRYQNDIIKALCEETHNHMDPFKRIIGFILGPEKCLENCEDRWSRIDCSKLGGWSLNGGTAYWSDKRLLKLMLDAALYAGVEHPEVVEMIHNGGYLAVHFTKLLATRAAPAEQEGAPWEAGNIWKYLEEVPKMCEVVAELETEFRKTDEGGRTGEEKEEDDSSMQSDSDIS